MEQHIDGIVEEHLVSKTGEITSQTSEVLTELAILEEQFKKLVIRCDQIEECLNENEVPHNQIAGLRGDLQKYRAELHTIYQGGKVHKEKIQQLEDSLDKL